MDLESECSALESVEDNEINLEKSPVAGCSGKNNGSCAIDEADKLSSADDVNAAILPDINKGKGVDNAEPVISPPSTAMTASGATPSTTKGYGLKKWRRIKRDVVTDGNSTFDSSKVLKRGLSSSENANPVKPLQFSVETKQNSEGSAGSANLLKNMTVMDGLGIRGSSPDSRFSVGSAFAVGADSENSEDRSSKSSTAASAPKAKYDIPAVLGNRMKNLSGKLSGNLAQRGQSGKGRVENSKKARGDRAKSQKENSHSSMESDSRSSNSIFIQGAFSSTIKGKQSRRSKSYDGVDSKNVHAGEQKIVNGKETIGDREAVSQNNLAADLSWEGKEERSENHRLPTDQDPLVDSIHTLQLLQETLEKEIQKFGEVRKDLTALHIRDDDNAPTDSTSNKPQINKLSSSDQMASQEIRQGAADPQESQVLSLRENVKFLESKLDEANIVLEAKESRLAELEAILSSSKPPNEACGSTMDLHQEKYRETETELEGLFRQRIEAEVEYLTITSMMQKLRVVAGDQRNHVKEQNSFAGEQVQVKNELEEIEGKAGMLKKQRDGSGNILETEEVLKIQGRVCKVTSFFFMQFSLLVLIWLFALQLRPQNGAVVPT